MTPEQRYFRKLERATAPTAAAESRSGAAGAEAAPFAMAAGIRWVVVLDPGFIGIGVNPSSASAPAISLSRPVHFVGAAGCGKAARAAITAAALENSRSVTFRCLAAARCAAVMTPRIAGE